MYPFTDRANSLVSGITFSLYGRLAIDLFACEKLLLRKTKTRIKLIRSRTNFYMLSDNPNVSLKIFDCSLFTRKMLVAEPRILSKKLKHLSHFIEKSETLLPSCRKK